MWCYLPKVFGFLIGVDYKLNLVYKVDVRIQSQKVTLLKLVMYCTGGYMFVPS